jgi:polyisoprenoid-binding protein YceI
MKSTLLFAMVAIAVGSNAPATELRVELDPENTAVTFRLKATMHSVHGSAEATSGSLTLDIETGDISGEVVIDAVSAETGNKKRDKKMHARVLRSADYNLIVLQANRLEGELALTGASDMVLHSEMSILGQPHRVEIPLHVEISNGQFTASGEFEVPYVEWGLEDPSTFVLRVAKEVLVTVEARGSVAVVDQGETGPATATD